ncbi:HAD family hydrolase [Tessaracoccus lacteus]|uniref:HAD-IA family hydrolase n=1 Tax=Tessaracoccus lacteus TaxID=3041766 RepID=A0ABY8PYD5_9ACTN|nr:HAD-IA family hydrolase [Tessaracoccus sp. T21]WGT47518.1 HAD-IA family hydrolase [Tessaracoccus sp. T21]
MSSRLGVFDAVIFDFDGTLADSHAAMMRSYVRWAEEYGVDLSQARMYTGRPSEAVARALVTDGRAEEAGLRLDALEVSDTDGVVALPGSLDALSALDDGRRAIATSCTMALVVARMDAAGLPLPAVVVAREQYAHGKPAPDPFLVAAQRLGVDPARCLVAEDAPAGVAGAHAAGCRVLGVLTSHTADELGADWHVGSLAEVSFAVTADGVAVSLA